MIFSYLILFYYRIIHAKKKKVVTKKSNKAKSATPEVVSGSLLPKVAASQTTTSVSSTPTNSSQNNPIPSSSPNNQQTVCPIIDPPGYDFVNVQEENATSLLSKLQSFADCNQATLMAFIAPYYGKKISPVDFVSSSIGFYEELGIEEVVAQIKKKQGNKLDKLFLLVESPGGIVTSSYKIARYLRANFTDITTFVAHEAASGGALIALIGNEVIMSEMANLGPIDVRVPYHGTRVSVNSMVSSLATLLDYFKTKRPEQVPYPYRALVDKLDPIIYDDWNAETYAMVEYTLELLAKAKYTSKDMSNIVKNFVLTNKTHSFVIHKYTAKDYGVNINMTNKYENELNCMKWWLKEYMLLEGTKHYIRYVVPNQKP